MPRWTIDRGRVSFLMRCVCPGPHVSHANRRKYIVGQFFSRLEGASLTGSHVVRHVGAVFPNLPKDYSQSSPDGLSRLPCRPEG